MKKTVVQNTVNDEYINRIVQEYVRWDRSWNISVRIRNKNIEKILEEYATLKVKEALQSNTEHKCQSCGAPLGNYCDRCQKLWES